MFDGIKKWFGQLSEPVQKELGLTGWVKNLEDGTVEMQVQGSTRVIDKLVEGLSDNQFIKIDRIDDQKIGINNSERKFEMAN